MIPVNLLTKPDDTSEKYYSLSSIKTKTVVMPIKNKDMCCQTASAPWNRGLGSCPDEVPLEQHQQYIDIN